MDAKTIEEIIRLNKKIGELNKNKENMTNIKFLEEKNRTLKEIEKLLD